jgi:hypothetical protein
VASRKIQLGARWTFWTTDDKSLSLKDLESIPVLDGLTFAVDSWKPVSTEEKAVLAEYLQLNETDWLSYVSSNFLAKLKSQAMLFAAKSESWETVKDFTEKDVYLPRSYYLPVAEALIEGKWLSPKNRSQDPYRELNTVAKRTVKEWKFRDFLFDKKILQHKEGLLPHSLFPNDRELSEIEAYLEVEKLAQNVGLSDEATELLMARIYLGVTRKDASKYLNLSDKEVRRYWKQQQRKEPKLSKYKKDYKPTE